MRLFELAPTLRRIKRLFRKRDGVAAVEFALVAPIMLILYMGSLEATQIVSLDAKLSASTSAVSDLISRVDSTLPASELDDYISAAGIILTPYSTSALKQKITFVQVAQNGSTKVLWSVGYNGATPSAKDSAFTLPTEIRNIAKNGWVIVSEGQLPYTPWGGYVLDEQINLYKAYYNLPRYGTTITLTGSSSSGTHGT